MGRIYLRYDLISQRPGEDQAFHPEYHVDFKTGGSAFSASTINIPINYDLMPMDWVMAEVILTGHTDECAVRIRRYEWRLDDQGVWTASGIYLPTMTPPILNAPRKVAQHITAEWHIPPGPGAQGGVYYALETKGHPAIYSAYIHGVTRSLESSGGNNPDLSTFIASCHAAGNALSNITT